MTLAINRASMVLRKNVAEKHLAIIFDNSEEKHEINQQIFAMYQRAHNKTFGNGVAGISFLSSEKFAPLQAADMIAWETYNYARKWVSQRGSAPIWPHFQPLVKSGRNRGKSVGVA
jgi:hypothetical protein